jgi:choline dehydrogenase-like flavoprotein
MYLGVQPDTPDNGCLAMFSTDLRFPPWDVPGGGGKTMILDYLEGSCPVDFEVDICIVGAGPAGLSIAHSFIGSKLTVCIIEGGGLDGEERSQDLYNGISIGNPAFNPGTSRMRAFGGSCNLWGGGCIPLAAGDFEARDWVPHSGWPLTYADLEPYYSGARSFCGIGPQDFTEGSFLTSPSRTPLSFDENLVNQLFVSTPVIFGKVYRAEFEHAPNVSILLHANLLEFESDAPGSFVRSARIRSLNGREGAVRARQYVLACGGIENARLLLLSNSAVPHGLGNARDLVGRYFMDHPTGKLGTLKMDAPHRLTGPYDHSKSSGAVPSLPEICLSGKALRKHRLLSGRVRPVAVEALPPKGIRALRDLRTALRAPARSEGTILQARLRQQLKNGDSPTASAPADEATDSVGKLALRAGLGAGDIVTALGRRLAGKPTVKIDHVDLIGFFEQAPNPDSRVTLADETDTLGQRKVCIDWQLTSLDRHTYRASAELFGAELTRTCGGEFQIEPWLQEADNPVPAVRGTAHHIGTTRMSDDAATGVVDGQCRVHGVDNLHVVGSSVFPTGGWAFPTFTIVALSLRLAEQLRMHMNDLVHLIG